MFTSLVYDIPLQVPIEKFILNQYCLDKQLIVFSLVLQSGWPGYKPTSPTCTPKPPKSTDETGNTPFTVQ